MGRRREDAHAHPPRSWTLPAGFRGPWHQSITLAVPAWTLRIDGDAALRRAVEALEIRAEIIVPLGGALIPYVVDPKDLAAATGVQVLNTKAIGIRFAEMCVACGMTQSALTYPRAKLTYEDFLK